jgi:UDP-N-acetylmuramate: L-alanyl-gamma-D-glutamyl-meso-diaminopimelate ligase
VEYILDRNINYVSGPQWLLENVLKDRWVIAVSGTHGKTTTSSMIAWILAYTGMEPGYLIGGVPQNFESSAMLGQSPFFVIEADEYDTAFFDKRSKFVHYRPRTLVINNMEFDHGDIFNDLSDIQKQFHHLIRMVPNNGLILSPKNEQAITDTLAMGCWTPTEFSLGTEEAAEATLGWSANKCIDDGSEFWVNYNNIQQGKLKWALIGDFNIDNALMAIAASRHAGITPAIAIEALADFINTKRRFELRGTVKGIRVFDDFAHHPTAITKTLAGVRANVGANRVIAVLEPRSNTMKSGIHKESLPKSLTEADMVYIFQGEDVKWSVDELKAICTQPCYSDDNIATLVDEIIFNSIEGDTIVVMSNGGFDAIHEKLLAGLQMKFGN